MEIKEFIIDEDNTMIDAMRQLDRVAKKVLFVTKNNSLKAAITDGDIRRWILKNGNLDAKVKDIANYNPKSLKWEQKSIAREYMKKHSIEALPIVNSKNNIVTILLWTDEEIQNGEKLKIPVVIMAGGLGTRLYPYTKILPKPLIPIGEIPIIEHIINHFRKVGVDHFFVIVNHKKNMIKAYLNEIERNYDITFVEEEQPLGTGGGLSLLKGMIESTFILTNCDILIEEDYVNICNYHEKENNHITMVCSLKNMNIPYGVVEINETGTIKDMKEKPQISFFANTGMYVVKPGIIEEMEEGKAVSFPEIIQTYIDKGLKVGVYPISEENWLDMGQFDEMDKMRRRLKIDD